MNERITSLVVFVYLAAFCVFVLAGAMRKESLERAGRYVTGAGIALHTIGIGVRWLESHLAGAGHIPLSNFYESLVFFSWSLVFLLLVLERGRSGYLVRSGVMLVAFILLAYASLSASVDAGIKPLVPALKSDWLAVHVVTCFLGYAAFVIASLAGIVSVWRKDRDAGGPSDMSLVETGLKAGYVFFSLGIVTGSVWAHMAWGRYWGWDPKETWALITWLIYTAALHERLRTKRKKVFVSLLVTGLASVAFTYVGVNYLPGLHSYM